MFRSQPSTTPMVSVNCQIHTLIKCSYRFNKKSKIFQKDMFLSWLTFNKNWVFLVESVLERVKRDCPAVLERHVWKLVSRSVAKFNQLYENRDRFYFFKFVSNWNLRELLIVSFLGTNVYNVTRFSGYQLVIFVFSRFSLNWLKLYCFF